MSLRDITFGYPAIDNHAHPLLKEVYRSEVNFDGLISEAQGPALAEDALHTLACYRATRQLGSLYEGVRDDPSWEDLKAARAKVPYDELCRKCFEPAKIQCLLLDDGLGGVEELCEDYRWHDGLSRSPSKRIIRVEVVAQVCCR